MLETAVENDTLLPNVPFEVEGITEDWIYFKRGVVPNMEAKEEGRRVFEEICLDKELATNLKVPEEIKGVFRVSLTVPSDKVVTVLKLLYENTAEVPISGKVLADLESEEGPDMPRIVLYMDDPNMHLVPEFSIQLSQMLEQSLGEDNYTPQHMDMAFHAGPYVNVSQGLYDNKNRFRNQNDAQFSRLYALDGAIYADNARVFEENYVRATNQVELYEHLIEFTGLPLQERIEGLQKEIMRGLPVELGIRKREVRMGGQDKNLEERYIESFTYVPADYYPPNFQRVERLITMLDSVKDEYAHVSDVDMQNRLCALMYVGMLATHPLEDGNGQVASNLVSTILLEYGRKDYFINTQELGKMRVASALVIEPSNIRSRRATQIIQVPGRSEESIPEMQANKAMTLRREASFEVLHWLFSDDSKKFRDKYMLEGIIDSSEVPSKIADNLSAFCVAIVNYEQFLKDGTETDLVGDLSKTFADLSESHEKAMRSTAS